ncbi:hypothetical protein HYPSUDRAFT_58593 [Hypholoma sublateritium FD-334 SS-4]|uniref:Xylanolytic transcriptional activator regulatory domain-containing protein n=1 Tax=Hypholoma sublateritium (strain FD-334 SS-4) TaxID=945553 RepID=A0A0D2N9L5_HYPSF|nr:hypothetical protein HYPSUDRAFT_58593 [Hypholoma sublateritium FD-334 SS-4]
MVKGLFHHILDGQDNIRLIKRARSISPVVDRGKEVWHTEDNNLNNRKLRSCKECPLFSPKCDRNFPCQLDKPEAKCYQKCVSRGCSSLCPDGTLTSGPGSRFILAGTEQLHDELRKLGNRVLQLEEALGEAYLEYVGKLHPLLAPGLLKIKIAQNLYDPAISVSPPAPGESLRQSVRASSLKLQPIYAESSRPCVSTEHMVQNSSSDLSFDALKLSASFPFPWTIAISMRRRIREALPPRMEAQRICEEMCNNALWQFNLDSLKTFIPNLLNYCYTSPIETLSPRRLALLLMHLSIGSIVDLRRPALRSSYGDVYHHLARAAICETPLIEEPDFDVLHVLFFMIWYHLSFSSHTKAVGHAWNLMGIVAKLAQGLGLHRDKPQLKILPEEDEKRRALFRELMDMDCRMALSLGRPPSIQPAHVDIKPPTCFSSSLYVARNKSIFPDAALGVDHEWKNMFFTKCLMPILSAVVAVQLPEYTQIIVLDCSVRDFDVPVLLDEHQRHAAIPYFLVMQHGLVAMSREIVLLQLHRKYFNTVMEDAAEFDLAHQYAPSVIATYLAAANLIGLIETLFSQQQQLSVTLALLISRASTTPLATSALGVLEKAYQLFVKAEKTLPFSSSVLSVMQKLLEKSQRTLAERYISNVEHVPASHPQLQTQLPSFANVHPQLMQAAAASEACGHPGHPMHVASAPTDSVPESAAGRSASAQEAWLPDIYHFSILELSGVEGAGTVVLPEQMLNVGHAALSIGLLEKMNYMAWF